MKPKMIAFAALSSLAACRDQTPPTPSAEQTARLNEAEGMLNNFAASENAQDPRSPSPR